MVAGNLRTDDAKVRFVLRRLTVGTQAGAFQGCGDIRIRKLDLGDPAVGLGL